MYEEALGKHVILHCNHQEVLTLHQWKEASGVVHGFSSPWRAFRLYFRLYASCLTHSHHSLPSSLHSTPWDQTSSCYWCFATLFSGWHYTCLWSIAIFFFFLFPIDEVPEMNWQLHFALYGVSKATAEASMKVSSYCNSQQSWFLFNLAVCFVLVYLICFLHVLPLWMLVVCVQFRGWMSFVGVIQIHCVIWAMCVASMI